MAKRGETAVLYGKLPTCQAEGCGELAHYDAWTRQGWGYLCQKHFDQMGCTLGWGRGQVLVQMDPAKVVVKLEL